MDKSEEREKCEVFRKGGRWGLKRGEDIEEMDVWWKEATEDQKKRGDVSGHLHTR